MTISFESSSLFIKLVWKLFWNKKKLWKIFESNRYYRCQTKNKIFGIAFIYSLTIFFIWLSFTRLSLSPLSLSLFPSYTISCHGNAWFKNQIRVRIHSYIPLNSLLESSLLHMTYELFVWFYQFRFSKCQIKVSNYILDTHLWFDCYCWWCCCCCCYLWKWNPNHHERASNAGLDEVHFLSLKLSIVYPHKMGIRRCPPHITKNTRTTGIIVVYNHTSHCLQCARVCVIHKFIQFSSNKSTFCERPIYSSFYYFFLSENRIGPGSHYITACQLLEMLCGVFVNVKGGKSEKMVRSIRGGGEKKARE